MDAPRLDVAGTLLERLSQDLLRLIDIRIPPWVSSALACPPQTAGQRKYFMGETVASDHCPDDSRPVSFYGLYAGQLSGTAISKYLLQKLHPAILESQKFQQGDIRNSIIEAFSQMEEAMKLERLTGPSVEAVIGLIIDGKLIVANAGPTQAVVVSKEQGSDPIIMEHETPDLALYPGLHRRDLEQLGGFGDFGLKHICKLAMIEPTISSYILFPNRGFWPWGRVEDLQQFATWIQSADPGLSAQGVADLLVEKSGESSLFMTVVKLHW